MRLENIRDPDHVMLRNTLRYAHNQANLSLDRLLDTGRGKRRRDKDRAGIGTGLLYRVCNGSKNWLAEMFRAGLLRVRSTNDVRAVINRLLSVESALSEGGDVSSKNSQLRAHPVTCWHKPCSSVPVVQ